MNIPLSPYVPENLVSRDGFDNVEGGKPIVKLLVSRDGFDNVGGYKPIVKLHTYFNHRTGTLKQRQKHTVDLDIYI